jgi:hypothetical protein
VDQLRTRAELVAVVRELREALDRDIAQAGPERSVQPGSFGQWSFKDVVAHLTGWRLVTAARLEAGWREEEPVFPWPSHLDESEGPHEINQWFYEANRDKPLDEVLVESREAFERVERAIAEMPEEALLEPGRFSWLYWTDEALGPAVVRGSMNHYYSEHQPAIQAWLEGVTPEQS